MYLNAVLRADLTCCKQCDKFKGTMTKWPIKKPTHRTNTNTSRTSVRNTHFVKKTHYFCVFK